MAKSSELTINLPPSQNRNAKAAELAAKYDSVQKEIIAFMQEDEQIKQGGWNGSPYQYLQYVLTKWAMDHLHP